MKIRNWEPAVYRYVSGKSTRGPRRGILQGEKVTVSVEIFFSDSFIPVGEWELEFPAAGAT